MLSLNCMNRIKAAACAVGCFSFPLFAALSFSGDWEAGLTGKGNWKGIQAVSGDRFTRVTSPLRQGHYAARVEVRPGDDPIGSSGERAEVLVMTDSGGNSISENESSGTQYYAFSVRLDSAWQNPAADANGAWAIVFQLHGPDALGTSPSFAVSVFKHLTIALHSGDLDSAAKSLQWKSYALSDSGLNPGRWIDLVIKIRFARDFTGAVTVWRRNEGQPAFTQVLSLVNVPTLQYRSSLGGVGSHYWKHGFYRSKQTSGTNVLWLDGLTRGDSYDSVVAAAFGGISRVLPLIPAVPTASCALTVRIAPAGVRFLVTTGRTSPFSLEVIDAQGNLLWKTHGLTGPAGTFMLQWAPEARIRPGIYFATLRRENSQITRKFLVPGRRQCLH